MSSQADSKATVNQTNTSKCERCRRSRARCLKGVIGMAGCKRCSYLGFECNQFAETNIVSALKTLSVSQKSQIARPAKQEEQHVGSTSKERSTVVEDLMKEDKDEPARTSNKQELGEKVELNGNLQEAESAGSKTEREIVQAFKDFAKTEREKLVEKKRVQIARDRTVKLQDLKRFSQSFNLKTPVPTDLVSILAKDPEKQQMIVEKAKREHDEAKTDDDCLQSVRDVSSTSAVDDLAKRTFLRPKKYAPIVIKSPSGEVVDISKLSSGTIRDPDPVPDDVKTPLIVAQTAGIISNSNAERAPASPSHISTDGLPTFLESSPSSLYITGIDARIPETTLRQIFETCGSIATIRVSRSSVPHAAGCAYIDYDDAVAARKAILTLNGRKILDTAISVGPLHNTAAQLFKKTPVYDRTAHKTGTQASMGSSSTGYHAPLSQLPNFSGTSATATYAPSPYQAPFVSTLYPYGPPPVFTDHWTSIAQKLSTLFSYNSLTTNPILRRNLDFDGYISISVLVQYKAQLDLPSAVSEYGIGFAAHYYCSSVECGADRSIRCCLRLRNMPGSILADHTQRRLEFPCRSRGKHVPFTLRMPGRYGSYSSQTPQYRPMYGSDSTDPARFAPPYSSYTSSPSQYQSLYTPYPSIYQSAQIYGQSYTPHMPSTMNYAPPGEGQGHSYGPTNLYNDATAVFGDIYQTHNYYSQQHLQATNTSSDQQEQFIEQVLHVAARFGISTPQVPAVKSKDEVSRWIRDVYEAQLEASTVFGGQMSMVAPSNGTSLEPLDRLNETEEGDSRAASPGSDADVD